MKYRKKTVAIILSLMMLFTMIPAASFAEDEIAVPEGSVADELSTEVLISKDQTVQPVATAVEAGEEEITDFEEELYDTEEPVIDEAEDLEEAESIPDDADFGEDELDFGLGIDPEEDMEGADSEEQVEAFLLDDGETFKGESAPSAPLSVKGNRLSGKDLTYYKAFKSIIKNVSASKTKSTKKKLKATKITGKRTFTAKQLGVKRIGYKKNGVWHVSDAAMKKVYALVAPKDWKRVYTCALSDLSNESFWVDWHSKEYFIDYNCGFRYNASSLTFYSNDSITCRLPVQPEFQGSTFKVNRNKINNVEKAKNNAKDLIRIFDEAIPTQLSDSTKEEIDYWRLWNYCRWIAYLNTYDHYAANANQDTLSYKGPWSWVYVFDGDSSTNAVCEGYARAFKYICDMSNFNSSWIDCQIVSGKINGGGKHMWNIVRMNDGLNYVIDPTWMDEDDESDPLAVDANWFLKGAPSGSADRYTINENTKDEDTRVYDSWTKHAFASAERKLSTSDYPNPMERIVQDRTITIKSTSIKKITAGRKSFKIKWKKMSSPLGALYVDGYQIQYSTKKSFKSAKAVTAKGYGRTSKTIKKLRSGKKYYVRIRTYAKVGNKTYFSKWSKIKAVRVR